MNPSSEVLAALVASGAAVLSAIFSLFSFYQSRKNQKTSTYNKINETYNKIITFRIEHPEVLSLSRKWNPGIMPRIYEQNNEEDKQWVVYYTFVEMCNEYCNEVLIGWIDCLLDDESFFNQYEPLVRLLQTEHNLLVNDLLRESHYISKLIKDYRQLMQEKGLWCWDDKFKDVTKITANESLDEFNYLKRKIEMKKIRRRRRIPKLFGRSPKKIL